MYTRGVVYGMIVVEALRVAQAKYGKGKVMTPEQLRWGFEHLNLTEARIKELGAPGLFPPIKTSCADHEGSGMVKFQMWDGNGFKQVTPFMAGDREMVRKMVEETAAKYAAEKKITPRDCGKEDVDGARDGPARLAAATTPRPQSSAARGARLPLGEQHRGHLRPRDPRAEGRVARGAARAGSSRCSAPTAPARARR